MVIEGLGVKNKTKSDSGSCYATCWMCDLGQVTYHLGLPSSVDATYRAAVMIVVMHITVTVNGDSDYYIVISKMGRLCL